MCTVHTCSLLHILGTHSGCVCTCWGLKDTAGITPAGQYFTLPLIPMKRWAEVVAEPGACSGMTEPIVRVISGSLTPSKQHTTLLLAEPFMSFQALRKKYLHLTQPEIPPPETFFFEVKFHFLPFCFVLLVAEALDTKETNPFHLESADPRCGEEDKPEISPIPDLPSCSQHAEIIGHLTPLSALAHTFPKQGEE